VPSNGTKVAKLDRIIELYDAKTFRDKRKENQNSNNNHKNDSTLTKIDKNNNNQNFYKQQKQTVNFAVKPRSNKLKAGKKIYEFYNAPITKFWQNTLLYVIFLMCFTFIVLVKTPETPSVVEMVVMAYIFSLGLDKIRDVN
jgi:transient receptor potential cation channel subfamily M member 3